MKRRLIAFGLLVFLATALNGCASLHDGKGWEHERGSKTHQDSSPYLFEHRH